jgi:hypothetical protein
VSPWRARAATLAVVVATALVFVLALPRFRFTTEITAFLPDDGSRKAQLAAMLAESELSRVMILDVAAAPGGARAPRDLALALMSELRARPDVAVVRSGFTDEDVERMLMESFEHAEDDLNRRNVLTERVEAERILAATRTAFETDADLLAPDVRTAGEAAMAGDDYLAIRRAVEALDIATKPFAQLRMNRAIDAGFRGKTIEEAEGLAAHGDAHKHEAHATGGQR